jgi:hypothetical protein
MFCAFELSRQFLKFYSLCHKSGGYADFRLWMGSELKALLPLSNVRQNMIFGQPGGCPFPVYPLCTIQGYGL